MSGRRLFLRNLALASTALALRPAMSAAGSTGAAAPASRPAFKPDRHSLAAFSALEGATFRVVGTDQTVVLHRVEPLRGCARTESFLLKFRGPMSQPLAEQTHQFHHPELGQMPIFLQPRRVVEGECCYSANFCRLT